jgi:hypothetical protein
MEKKYISNAMAEPLREASEMKPWLFRFITKMKVYNDTGYARLKYKFFRMTTKKSPESSEIKPLNLQPGEWVEVKSMREISLTLDERGRHKGLYFMPEMEQFCGKQFKVFKNVQTILLEESGELRKIKSPTYFLEGVFCDGSQQGGCDRSCFHFWREDWLKRVYEAK